MASQDTRPAKLTGSGRRDVPYLQLREWRDTAAMPGAVATSASVAVTSALNEAVSAVGTSSLGRIVSGVDTGAHNLIDGMMAPAAELAAASRGYKYRNNGVPDADPVLTPQQLQVTKTSTDQRIMRIQRDAVKLLKAACQTSDALGNNSEARTDQVHPEFEDIGAAHLRLTLPVPTTVDIVGFHHRVIDNGTPGSPSSDKSDTESSASSEDARLFPGGRKRHKSPMSDLFGFMRAGAKQGAPGGVRRPSAQSNSPLVSSHLTQSPLTWLGPEVPREDEQSLGVLGNAVRARNEERAAAGQSSGVCQAQCDFCTWLGIGKAAGYLSSAFHLANPSGMRNLYVIDVILPTQLVTACMETADSLMGEEKPARNLQIQKAQRKLKRLVSGKVTQEVYNYLQVITNLTVMTMLLDHGETGKDHCHILRYTGKQPVFADFFANTPGLEDAVEDLDNAKKEAGHANGSVVMAVPAPEVKGGLNEVLVMYETEAFVEYELTEKKPVVGAVHVGADLLGKPSPNDHKNPLSFISAVYRHLGDSDTVVAEGTPYEYVVHLDRSEKSKLSVVHDRVWEDLIEDHLSDFKLMLTSDEQRFDYDFFTDGKPNSYCREHYEKWLEEQLADEAFFASDNALCELLSHTKATSKHMQELRASAQCKKGEDSTRARAVITPGVAGSEGLHQARTSPIVKALEALHAILYNHTNLKGLTEETKRIRLAEFLRAVPKGGLVFGTDKSKNDACFRDAVWKKCVKYLARMNDLFEEMVATRAYVYSPEEAYTDEAFPTGTLDMKYWIIKLTPLLAILLSGIGPTSFFNRLESTVENGTAVLETYGEEAYEKWRLAERRAVASSHPRWSNHELPHVAEIVEWAPLRPHMVKDTSVSVEKLEDEHIETHHMGIYEGDDQVHAIIPPRGEGWDGLGTRDVIMKYTSGMSKATGFIFEAALTADDMDMVGRNSVFEMLSAWVSLPSGNADQYEVAVIVPKVLKAIRKLPHCTISSQHTIEYDEYCEPVNVVKNAEYWSLALTKYYALAIMNHESLGVRGLFLAHGEYCYQRLDEITGGKAYYQTTVYGDRDPERRRLEEAASTTYDFCGVLREKAHELIASVKQARVLRTCCAAWRSELAPLAAESKEDLVMSLLAFDSTTLSLQLTEQHVRDPMLLWGELDDIGVILKPLAMHATANMSKVAAMFRGNKIMADSEETVRLARLYASTKPSKTAGKDGRLECDARPGTRAGDKGATDSGGGKDRPSGGGKSKFGKGKGKPHASGKGSHHSGKGKAPQEARGKGKGPRPSHRPNNASDSWWRLA